MMSGDNYHQNVYPFFTADLPEPEHERSCDEPDEAEYLAGREETLSLRRRGNRLVHYTFAVLKMAYCVEATGFTPGPMACMLNGTRRRMRSLAFNRVSVKPQLPVAAMSMRNEQVVSQLSSTNFVVGRRIGPPLEAAETMTV